MFYFPKNKDYICIINNCQNPYFCCLDDDYTQNQIIPLCKKHYEKLNRILDTDFIEYTARNNYVFSEIGAKISPFPYLEYRYVMYKRVKNCLDIIKKMK